MTKQKKQIEFRYYEIPQGHYVLPLMGEAWIQHYAPEFHGLLHFHNYLEIGYCYWGNGSLYIEDNEIIYRDGLVSLIPENIPHTTESIEGGVCKWEFLFIDINNFIRNEMGSNRLVPEDIIKLINKQAHVVSWKEQPSIAMIVKNILDEYRAKKPHYKESIKGYLRLLVIEMLRLEEEMDTSVTFDKRKQLNIIEKSVDYVEKNYSEDIKINELASICGLSESHFRRIFEETMQMKPLDYVNMIRIDKACEMLKTDDVGVDEVGYRVGYQIPSTFNRNFKKLTGKTPYNWKKTVANEGVYSKNYKISAKKGW